MRRTLQFIVLVAICGVAQAQEIAVIAELDQKFQSRLAETMKPLEAAQAKLVEGYSRFLQDRLKDFQSKADLDKVIQIQAEQRSVENDGAVGTDEFPGIQSAREIFQKQRDKLDAERQEVERNLRTVYIEALASYQKTLTRAGNIELARTYAEKAAEQEKLIAELGYFTVDEAILKSVALFRGDEANRILQQYDETINIAREATAEASSTHPIRERASSLIRKSRGNDIERFDKVDVWCLKDSTGWLKLKWEEPLAGKTILLVNRPSPGNEDDLRGESEVRVNGRAITPLNNFGRGMIALIELEAPVKFEELHLEVLKGTWSPGLYAIEIYP